MAKAHQQALPLKEGPLLMLIDGHALVHRAWHAIQQPLTVRKTGEESRAVFGFASTFLKALGEWSPDYVAIAFDRPVPTFRHKAFAEYKAQRPEAPQELRHQFIRVRQMMEAFRVPIYEMDGYEADDLLATLSAQAEAMGLDTVILTGDTDTLQLVSPRVRVALHYRIQERIIYDEAQVRERYGGLSPRQLPDLKALRGDPTDNIPGVPGIGEKTAVRLLLEFGSVPGIYENIGRVPPPLRETLEAHREQVFRGLKLVRLVRDLPVHLDLEACRFGRFDRREVLDLFRELEFFSLVGRIPGGEAPEEERPAGPAQVVSAERDYRTVDTPEALEEVARALAQAPRFTFDTETTSTDPMQAEVVGISLAVAPGRAFYIPVGHSQGRQLPLPRVLGALRPFLEGPDRPRGAHNANFDMTLLWAQGVRVPGVAFDTMLAAHLLGRKAVDLKALTLDLLGEEMTPISTLLGKGRGQRTMAQVPIQEAATYACADADMTLRLWPVLEEDLKRQGLWSLYADLELPLVPVLVRMQVTGVAIDVPFLREMSRSLGEKLAELERQAYESVGHVFNLNSPKQLSQILFEELRLPKTKRTRTGGYTTDAAALEELKEKLRAGESEADPRALGLLDILLEHRQLAKLKSTYVDALPAMVNPRTGRVHTSYNQASVVTGRISSSEPNLQNIPIRTDVGRQIRRAFIPGEEGWLLVGADYSQIELRVLAHLSGDPALVEAFHKDLDIHSATASQVFGVPLDQVTAEQRRIAKVLNFGVIYGLSAYGISQQTEMTPEEGQQFIEQYLGKYPGVRAYIERTKEQARTQGSVQTLLGRRRAIPEIHSPNGTIRAAAEREAVNMPVQGTAAEIMKKAMIQVDRRLQGEGLRARMLLQVHDELVFEAPQGEVEALTAILREVMPGAMSLAVPLKVDISVGRNWGEL